MANIVVAAIAKWNGSALVKGEKQLTQFQKTTNKLAKSFITLFAAQKIYAFGKASVKAFAADEKAAKSLAIALKNTGNGFATIATEGFIARLQDTYKVLDDELRPARITASLAIRNTLPRRPRKPLAAFRTFLCALRAITPRLTLGMVYLPLSTAASRERRAGRNHAPWSCRAGDACAWCSSW